MTTQYAIVDDYGRNSAKRLMLHDTEILNAQARFAMELIGRWGMVAGEIDGEDTAGRSILRPCTPNEVVDRACVISSQAFAEFQARGWISEGPDVSKLMRASDD